MFECPTIPESNQREDFIIKELIICPTLLPFLGAKSLVAMAFSCPPLHTHGNTNLCFYRTPTLEAMVVRVFSPQNSSGSPKILNNKGMDLMALAEEDPSIAGMVLDSSFSNLYNLMLELAEVYKIRLPKFTVKMALQYMRRVIQRKAKFDIMDLNVVQGDRNIIKFDGDHNSPRPQFYYDSVSIFFYNVLHPPQIPSAFSSNLEKYYDFGDLQVGAGADESVLYEVIAGLRTARNDLASSSSAATEISKESIACMSMNDDDVDFLLEERNSVGEMDGDKDDECHPQEKAIGQNVELHSSSSSNRDSFGRCSSLGGGSPGSSSGECTENHSRRHQSGYPLDIKVVITNSSHMLRRVTPRVDLLTDRRRATPRGLLTCGVERVVPIFRRPSHAARPSQISPSHLLRPSHAARPFTATPRALFPQERNPLICSASRASRATLNNLKLLDRSNQPSFSRTRL
ncbi:hypothetical protein AXF42_Ash001784 [Apostasia shenzhenica]|uniref:Uncharacterized protein n=1 Tax=Apostasia shenzhenica TaxID=1088818 RepID=A0A2I0AB74_9ASPA|nr:hypothetical protein AXF42_Ash001784 [Apostasia shenzhenica]